MTETPFIEHDRRRAEKWKRLGIDDLDPGDRYHVMIVAYQRLRERRWGQDTTEEEEVKIFQETKQQYLEYKKYKGDER